MSGDACFVAWLFNPIFFGVLFLWHGTHQKQLPIFYFFFGVQNRMMGDALDTLFTDKYNAWVEEEENKKSSQVDTQEEEEGGEFFVKWKVRSFALCVC